MIKNLICICCPKGCHLKVDTDLKKVEGNSCIKGEEYGINEVTNPVRTVTSTAKINSINFAVIPVKTDKPIKKDLMLKCIKEINKINAKCPVKVGDVLLKDVLETGVNIVASKTILE
ncbi:DUF1667 domain-containing protein [Clostridium sp. BJN0001]|uniref:DUF1667 domain-containing protein n=1 Tax=Clostridium sp. BJN0001 TaxID=2930219 RepID=UPI001FD547F3|nr:DUF1667 domain-containing protein [Clostridium sp. BJN0001]